MMETAREMNLDNLFVVGLNHRTAPVAVRELYSINKDEAPAALRFLGNLCWLKEAVLVSTCNRTEIYGYRSGCAGDPAGLLERLVGSLRPLDDATVLRPELLYLQKGEEAVHHLFRVASSLDSLVLGETEIAGQVKDAYRRAYACGTTGKLLNRLFQKAFSVSKAVRTRSGIGRSLTSVGSVSVDLAGRILGSDLRRKTILIIGAGKIGETTMRHLNKQGNGTVLVCNRSAERAAALAAEFDGEAVPFDALPAALKRADIVIGSTAAPHHVVTRTQVEQAMAGRSRPLFLIDLAVPRDVDPAVRDLDGVYLWNIDELAEIANQNQATRVSEAKAGEELVAVATEKFAARFRPEAAEAIFKQRPAGLDGLVLEAPV